jgi:hypothetical protein
MMMMRGKIIVPLLLLAIIFSFMPQTECLQNDNYKITFPAIEASYIYIKYDKNFIDRELSMNTKFSSKAETEISNGSGYTEFYENFANKKTNVDAKPTDEAEIAISDSSGYVRNYENFINKKSNINTEPSYKAETAFPISEASYVYKKFGKIY